MAKRMTMDIARLVFSVTSSVADKEFFYSPCYEKFLIQHAPEDEQKRTVFREAQSETFGTLTMLASDTPWSKLENAKSVLFIDDSWELRQNESGEFVFSSPHEHPVRYTTISPDFSTGVVQADFSACDNLLFPVTDNVIQIYVNWLASYGDFILHASGVAFNGDGYCFVGESGAGKSTLVETLVKDPSITVLGEDQVIVRFLEGKFWIYGTPWHTKPEMCSPVGVPLQKLFFLERSFDPQVQAISPVNAVARIMRTAFIPYYRKDLLPGILARLDQISQSIPLFTLTYPLGYDVWQLIRYA